MHDNLLEFYIGSPLEVASEQQAFLTIVDLVTSMQVPAIIIGNIHINQVQVDLIVAFDRCAYIIEVKGNHFPVFGNVNGAWSRLTSTGEMVPTRNYYDQALKASYAVKDAIGSTGYFQAMLLFVPGLHPSSKVPPTDFKVSIRQLVELTTLDDSPMRDGNELSKWRNFAMKNNLERVDNIPGVISASLNKEAHLLDNYCKNVQRFYEYESRNFTPVKCLFNDRLISSDQVPGLLSSDTNYILSGPSGFSKTMLAKYIAGCFAKEGNIVVYLEAKYFDGFLNPLLDSEVKLMGIDTGGSLFRICQQLEKNLTIIIDGHNECSAKLQRTIDKCILAMCNRYNVHVIVVAQKADAVSALLGCNHIAIQPPSIDVKRQIAASAGGKDVLAAVEPILEIATSGMEAMIIGNMGTFKIENKSRFSLFYYYVRKKLGHHANAGIRVLSRLALSLHDTISFSMSLRKFEILMVDENVSPDILDLLIEQNILRLYFDKISFSHELFLQTYIAATLMHPLETDSKKIIEVLEKPINHDARILLIGAIEDTEHLVQVLESIKDDGLITQLFLGEAGIVAKQWTEAKFRDFLQGLEREVKQIHFVTSSNKITNIALDEVHLNTYTALDYALLYSFAELLVRGFYINELLQIIATADKQLEKNLSSLSTNAGRTITRFRDDLFTALYIPFNNSGCGIGRIVTAIRSGLVSIRIMNLSIPKSNFPEFSRKDLSDGQLFLAISISRFTDANGELYDNIIRRLKDNFSKLPYHLKIAILDCAGRLWDKENQRLALIDILSNLQPADNIFVSSSITEAMQQLGAFESEEQNHGSTVEAEIAGLLSEQDKPDNWARAYGVFASQFDHPFNQTYYMVINNMPFEKKKAFMTMVLKGSEDNFFAASAIMSSAELEDATCCVHLLKWTSPPPFDDSHYPQDDIKCYFLVHLIFGQFEYQYDSLLGKHNSTLKNTLCAAAEILYTINRRDYNSEQKIKNCAPQWDYLENKGFEYAVDAIYHAITSICGNDIHYHLKKNIVTIGDIFPDKIVHISRNAIMGSDQLQSISSWDKKNISFGHAISFLGQHGGNADIVLLKTIANDPEFGQSAIVSIKKLEAQFM